ncbi:MAG: hypothetical protein IKQ25_02255 [Lachnospiraceae bacterium]|nr:hypothetical protein [Lachnospiraceae bacterium]
MTMALTACEGKNQTDGETMTQEISQEVSQPSSQVSEEAEGKTNHGKARPNA